MDIKCYKFYLSFENSVCNDYVTEKFYEILAHDLVPVVYGGINYAKVAPPHSYINALKYTPQQLAHYLHQIGNNDTLYNEYLWWKDDYVVESDLRDMARHGFCDLCQKLHQDQGRVKYYPSLLPDWHSSKCFRPHYKSNSSNRKGLSKKTSFHEKLNLKQSLL